MTGNEVTEESVRRSLRGIVNGAIAKSLEFYEMDLAPSCHSGAREARTSDAQLRIGNLEILRRAIAHRSSMLRIAPE